MRTTLDQDTILYAALAGSSVKTMITGGIYKEQRPTNSVKEDVVIAALPITTGSVQAGTSIVNIHVPDLDVTIDGQPQKVPNTGRLSALCDAVMTAIESTFSDNYNYWISSQVVLQDETLDNHFVSFKVQFKFDNTPIS